MPKPEFVVYGSPRHAALLRAFRLAGVDPWTVLLHGIIVHRNHIEYDEMQYDERGAKLLNIRCARYVTKHRIIRNPNPRLAATR